MDTIYGLYADPESAQRAVSLLESAGSVRGDDVEVVSSEPFEEYEFGRRAHHTIMPWLAALGGIAGGLLGYSFVAFTQKSYPLPTGGMSIVPGWPNGVITYELTMLGAILVTLATLIVTVRTPRGRPRVYDPAVSDGKILVGVVGAAEASRPSLDRLLRDAGAVSVVIHREQS